MKCITHKCPNHFWEGNGVTILAPVQGTTSYAMQFVCRPCWDAITYPVGKSAYYSQVATNFREILLTEQ